MYFLDGREARAETLAAMPEWELARVLAERPAVRINQLGYHPHGPKRATWVSAVPESVEFAVLDAAGEQVFTGRTEPWLPRPEPTSGLPVHVTGYGVDDSRHQRIRSTPPYRRLHRVRWPAAPTPARTPGFPNDPRLSGLAPQGCYLDEPTWETTNDICIRWNAPLVWVAGYLADHLSEH